MTDTDQTAQAPASDGAEQPEFVEPGTQRQGEPLPAPAGNEQLGDADSAENTGTGDEQPDQAPDQATEPAAEPTSEPTRSSHSTGYDPGI